MHPAVEASLHDCKILIRQCEIQHGIRLIRTNQRENLLLFVRIDRSGCDDRFGFSLRFNLCFECIALADGAGGDADFLEFRIVLTAFLDCDGSSPPV